MPSGHSGTRNRFERARVRPMASPDATRVRAVGRRPRLARPKTSGAALTGIELVHTLAWLSIESCMVYVLWAGFARRSDRRAAIAAGLLASESLVFAANRSRCPLTQIAERVGADRGSVTDIYLPRWFAHNLPAIHVRLSCSPDMCTPRISGRSSPSQR
jgi:hypothetical protein